VAESADASDDVRSALIARRAGHGRARHRLILFWLLMTTLTIIVLFVVAALWLKSEAIEPTRYHFPLSDGAQPALLACSGAYFDLQQKGYLTLLQSQADQAASINQAFRALAYDAAAMSTSHSADTKFVSFCKAHHIWP
jgi:hypothetical protein